MRIVYNANDITDAHLVAGLLEANGIKCHVGGHYLQGGIGELATMGFANVQVADEDFGPALNLLLEHELIDEAELSTGS